MCSIDWCAANPEGTVGEFNFYWDNLDSGLRKACLTRLYVQLIAHMCRIHFQVYEEREAEKRAEIKVSTMNIFPGQRSNHRQRLHGKDAFPPREQQVPSSYCGGLILGTRPAFLFPIPLSHHPLVHFLAPPPPFTPLPTSDHSLLATLDAFLYSSQVSTLV